MAEKCLVPLVTLAVVCVFLPSFIEGHGRLVVPPSRASMWRYGFKNPVNYNDNQVYCGGYSRQWHKNKGRCGICGDAYDIKPPRPHEVGGRYGNGIKVATYFAGDVFKAKVQVTAFHRGYFEFKLCPTNNPLIEATQECLDRNPLYLADGSGTKFYPTGNGEQAAELAIPSSFSCKHCVLQWTYTAGNNWGFCSDGKGAVGCGPQETFRQCADIEIRSRSGSGLRPQQANSGHPISFQKPKATSNQKPPMKPSQKTPTKPFRKPSITKSDAEASFEEKYYQCMNDKFSGYFDHIEEIDW